MRIKPNLTYCSNNTVNQIHLFEIVDACESKFEPVIKIIKNMVSNIYIYIYMVSIIENSKIRILINLLLEKIG